MSEGYTFLGLNIPDWLGDVVKSPDNPLNILSGVVSHPIVAVTQGPIAASKQSLKEGPVATVIHSVTNLGLAAAGVATAGAALAPEAVAGTAVGTAGTAIKSFALAKPILFTATAAGIEVASNVVAAAPTQVASVALNTPTHLATLGTDIGNTISDPSVSNAAKIFTDNKALVGVAGAAAVIAGGYGAANTLSTIVNTLAVKKNTTATEASANSGSAPITSSGDNRTIQILNQLPAPAAALPVTSPVTSSIASANVKPTGATTSKVVKKKTTKNKKTIKKKVYKKKSSKKVIKKKKQTKKRKK
jgi:hypothetical protein